MSEEQQMECCVLKSVILFYRTPPIVVGILLQLEVFLLFEGL